MPRPSHRPATSGYARLTQADEEDVASGYIDDDVDGEDPYFPRTPRTLSSSAPLYEPIQPGTHGPMSLPSGGTSPASVRRGGRPMRRRPRRNSSGVDIKALNARLERWADEIAARFKIHKVKGKSHEEEKLEIHHTVFQPPEGIRPLPVETLHSEAWLSPPGRMTAREYDEIVESVRTAIELGVHPIMISQGSSGSYFARNSDGKVVGVFKPKDEEPYASRNPKWTKWIHRNLFPCFFGRACLIPNLSYVSEAAAYTLDIRLCTNIVPPTDVVHLSSKSFYYDLWQRSAFYRKRKPLPEKPGSFQVFLNGFKDATKFFGEHPWPDDLNLGFRPRDVPKRRRWNKNCTPGVHLDEEDELEPEAEPMARSSSPHPDQFQWTDEIQQSFREELEKLVILDYIMRNTDRGLDNWMIKVDQENQKVSIVSEPMRMNASVLDDDDDIERPHPVNENVSRLQDPYRRQEAMTPISRSGTPSGSKRVPPPNMSIGAIDNSLSWPWKHPDAVSPLFKPNEYC
jgi:phosphatidylinositol 4-kinase type 2